MNRFISKETSLQLHQLLQDASFNCQYEFERNRMVLMDENGKEKLSLRLPIVVSPLNNLTRDDNKVNYIIALIQSGSCALGFYENGENKDHKVFKSYMVRMKQGKSQIKYLKTRGKSKAGSRVRLGETVDFFENINERLQEYQKDYEVHRIAISCSKILIPYLYNSKVPTPFEKNDTRIFKIPKHIHIPNYEVMTEINKFLLKGELIYEESEQDFVNELLLKSKIT